MLTYSDFFKKATGFEPFPWQIQMASSDTIPEIVTVPTGMGKTAGVVVSWLWRRQNEPETVSRRLVYCLPMRVLVEQTEIAVRQWLNNLELDTDCHILLGGHTNRDWDRYPERDSILIGTQDMLLSRALNRGYAASRFRWPVQFALLNNDCLWVMDEVQLMGVGLQTSLQLQAFREMYGHFGQTESIWMSATMTRNWLDTVDHRSDKLTEVAPDKDDYESPVFNRRYRASKSVYETSWEMPLEEQIVQAHEPGTLSIVVRNTVSSARETFKKLCRQKSDAEILLLHSRFRKPDRDSILSKVFSDCPPAGRILVATQVVEAGVDISAKTLFTDAAPWASLVQRFGRCNRTGEYNNAVIHWIRPEDKKGFGLPYDDEEVTRAVKMLEELDNAGSLWLPDFNEKLKQETVIRKRDMIDLFDTTPDLAGMDIDISRFIRNSDSKTVFVFWRELERDNLRNQQLPDRNELCRVPLSELRKHLKKKSGWFWNHLTGDWVTARNCSPGMTVMLNAGDGGYSREIGWFPSEKKKVQILLTEGIPAESNDDDPQTEYSYESIAQHTDSVVQTLKEICKSIGVEPDEDLLKAARWHDAGKTHWAFQRRFGNAEAGDQAKGKWVIDRKEFPRTGFRHELASALALLENGGSDLSAYLAAAHHGKVRMSIRSLPIETAPENGKRYARGVHEEDVLPVVDLGSGVTMPETTLALDLMELGGGQAGKSWLSRTLKLRNSYGPFRLAFLESLLRIADWRASEKGGEQ